MGENEPATQQNQLSHLLQILQPALPPMKRTLSGRTIPTPSPPKQWDARYLPFDVAVVSKHIDLSDATWAVIEDGDVAARAINAKATQLFTQTAYNLSATYYQGEEDSDSDSDEDDGSEAEGKKKEPKPLCSRSLAVGIHETTYKESRLLLLVQSIGDPVSGAYREPKMMKKYVLFTEGKGRIEFLEEFVEDHVKMLYTKPKRQHFQLYRWQHNCSYWKEVSNEKARQMESVILPEGMRESVEMDMKRFLSKNTRKWYDEKGIPYKRCYMFFGVPGTGKTSLITALAGRFRRKVCFLSAHHPKFTDEALKTALSRCPGRAIVVLEDIDSLFDKDRKSNNGNNPLTFTGLLNAVDGIGEHRGTIFIMTTNFIERLDSALIRAGRVDMRVEFKHADDDQLAKLFKWFYCQVPEEAQKFAAAFVTEVRKQFKDGVTMAELQQHFIDNMFNSPEICVENVKHYDLPLMQKLAAEKEEQRKKEEAEAKEKKKKEQDAAKENKRTEKEELEGNLKED